MPRGRVTAIGGLGSMPPPLPGSGSAATSRGPGPTVSSPLFEFPGNKYGNFFSQSSSATGSLSAPAPPSQVMGYSAAHSYHSQQTHEWSQRAYRGIMNSTTSGPGGIVTLNLGVYEPTVDPKGRPILVQVITFLLFN